MFCSLKKDIEKIEKVQRYFTRISLTRCRIPYMQYNDRLKLFNLQSLEFRRNVQDIATFYNIVSNRTCLNSEKLLSRRDRPNRTNNMKIFLKHCNNTTAKSFINRSTLVWNKLNQDIISSTSTSMFKFKVSKFLEESGTAEYWLLLLKFRNLFYLI